MNIVRRIILSADSTCDLDEDLKKRYGVSTYPLHVILGEKQYKDGVDITAYDIYSAYQNHNILPKTAAINVKEYIDYFKQWVDQGYTVIHFSIAASLSSSYQNCCIAAKELGNIYPIDSCNLSTGIGLLILEAAELIAKGMEPEDIVSEINNKRIKVHASFVLDTLEFLHAGGRCSALAALGANVLNIKPCIEVDNTIGKMKVGKKYRGPLNKVLKKYTIDKLTEYDNLELDRIFITHSGISKEMIELVRKTIEETAEFKEILITQAGCTISAHCGPNTLGVLFMTK